MSPASVTDRGIRSLFARIAPRYDLLNRLFSARRDVFWRWAAARLLQPAMDGPLLDVACGTLDLSLELARAHPGRLVVGLDFSLEMMRAGSIKPKGPPCSSLGLVNGDGLGLPFGDDVFAAAAMAFGIRNIPDRLTVLEEMSRVLKPNGRLVILELGRPPGLLARLYLKYLNHIMPFVARFASPDPESYLYLARSIMDFPRPPEFLALLRRAGFKAKALPLNRGIAWLFLGQRIHQNQVSLGPGPPPKGLGLKP